MLSNNFTQLIGYLGSDPEVLKTSDGREFAKVNIATTEVAKGESGKFISKPCWHVVYFNGKLFEYAKSFKKGMRIQALGKLDYKDWTDKKGVNHRSAFILAKEVHKFSEAKNGTELASVDIDDAESVPAAE
ncbi:MAG: single stranded DNA-binding protein [Gammaproteobacteria bacterium]|jgi:single stranded DNA-binding protein|nr:single stranded DNA-binding protein [Gammaproteobacteria bacterium]